MMKRLATLLVVALLTATSLVQAQPTFLWSRSAIGPTLDEARSVAQLPNGDILVSGVFRDSLVFGGQPLFTIGRNYDAYVARYSRSGALLSTIALGGLYEDAVQNIAVDKDGNYYVGISFSEQVQIGGEVYDGIDGESSTDIALVKYNRMGVKQWVKIFGSPDDDEEAPFLACDSVGNVYMAVSFGSEAEFGQRKVISNGNLDVAVVKVNGTTGEVVWARRGGGTDGDIPGGIAVTPNGDRIYVVGTFRGQAGWEFDRLESVNSLPDFFMMAYTSNGEISFLKRAGHSGVDRYITCAVDRKGDMVVTGAINGVTTFVDRTITTTGESRSDVFFARLSRNGDVKHLTRFGNIFEEIGLCIATDSKNNIYIGGRFDSLATFDGSNVVSEGGLDGFILRLTEDGQYDWVRSLGGRFDDAVTGILLNANNEPIFCGNFTTEASIGEDVLRGDRLTDVFLAAMECGPNTALLPASGPLRVCLGSDSLIQARPGYPTYEWTGNGTPLSETSHRFPLGSLPVGTYDVRVRITDQLDCMLFSETISVEIYEGMPEPVITMVGDILRVNIADKRYEWWREGRRITGANASELNVQGQGLYRVRVVDEDGCTRSASFVVGTTSVEEIAGTRIRLYPNPTSGDVMLDGLVPGTELSVYDVLGNLVGRYATDADTFIVPLTSVQSGVYTLILRTSQSQIMRKVVRW